MAMSEDTRNRLNRAIWVDRAKKAGIGLAIAAVLGAVMAYQGLDASVVDTRVSGVVEKVEPLIAPPSAAAPGLRGGLNVTVKLDSGRSVHVVAENAHEPQIGARIEIVEHTHGTGRVTHSLK
jgi:hypothetical protein